MQLISQMDQIFKMKKLNLWLRTYEILATGPRCGLIEAVSDSLSIDSIKKKIGVLSQRLNYWRPDGQIRDKMTVHDIDVQKV
jgi:hypothetical protein